MRKSNDYVPKMIDIAGGEYVFRNLKGEDNAASSVNMQMEEFYAAAKESDYLIYNSTIDGEIHSIFGAFGKSAGSQGFQGGTGGKCLVHDEESLSGIHVGWSNAGRYPCDFQRKPGRWDISV